ncbi:MAG: GNAT family N-acetyltransferase [Spirochaetaceae bacterium]|nr:MAG: GNAT family N-acetyltransferase [Spirochaetaceae bacterium]
MGGGNMSWSKAELADFLDLQQFLMKHEALCVGFSAWLKDKIISTPHIRNDFTVFIRRNKKRIAGEDAISEAVLITEQGLIFPLVKKRIPGRVHNLSELSRCIQTFPNNLNSVIGVSNSVDIIEKLVKQTVRSRVQYFLMVTKGFPKNLKTPASIRGVTIRDAEITDALLLFDLQKNYELEEVYLNPETFNETACYANLKNSLRKEIIIFAQRNGNPIAKVGTNARGYNMFQIGGVFTRPQERRKGLSFLLMYELLKRMFKDGKKACLFVKKTNEAAIKLYQKLGFDIIDNFRITYFKNKDV